MTLGRQLGYAVSFIFFVALAGVEVIHLRTAQGSLQQQLDALAQDAATSLGLSLGSLLRAGDAAMAETVIKPAFDRGHYGRIVYFSADGQPLVEKSLPMAEGNYPQWLARLLPLNAPTAESLVTAGWQQLGRVSVSVHPRYAYEQLWSTARDTVGYLLLIYAASMVALHFFLRGVLRPLAAVERQAQAISARNFVTLRIRPRTRELARVVEAMNGLSLKVSEVLEAETRRAERLQAILYGDPVTGLINARGFAARFQSAYEAQADAFAGTLALVEIAELGALNRELGSERCDALLRAVCREIDEVAKAAGGFAGRWTGATAIVALPQRWGERARERLGALRKRAGVTLEEQGIQGPERMFVGAVEALGGPASLHDLAHAAEEALRQSRDADEGMVLLRTAAADGTPDLVSVVRDALAERRLQLVGQVACRMSDHRVVHTEILARLRDADGREMVAAQFMPVVAAHGLVEALDRAVIEQVVQLARARDEFISINVSMHSAEQAEFLQWLGALLRRDRRAAERLVFETAEHGVVRNEAAAARFAEVVSSAGAAFAIDHFGVHRDSLALVPRLKPAYLKLAGSYTPRMVSDPGARFFAESVIRAARQLDIPVIAQMVEEDETFQSLGALGFAGYQGNLIDRPHPWPGPLP